MSFTIACPDCRATLKANKAPRSDKLMQCLKCGHRFTMSDSIAATSSTDIIASIPLLLPKMGVAPRMPRVLLGAVAVMILAVAGFFGAYFAALPVRAPLSSKASAVAEVKEPLPEPKAE